MPVALYPSFKTFLSITLQASVVSIILMTTGCSSSTSAVPHDVPTIALTNAIASVNENCPIDTTTDERLSNEWWKLFHDDQLSRLIESGIQQNPTLEIAQANIRHAMTAIGHAKAPLYPHLLWGADVSRQKLSETGLLPFNTHPTGLPPGAGTPLVATAGKNDIPVYFTQTETEFSLTYEFDFWGKHMNTVRAAISQLEARRADEAFSLLQLSTAIAATYFDLQTNYKRLTIYTDFIKQKEAYLNVIKKRIDANIDTAFSLIAAESELANATEQRLEIEQNIITNDNLIKMYLAGDFNEIITEVPREFSSIGRIPLPSDLPLNLIAQRPEIASQLWLIESATKEIKVAKAGFYPNFNLMALFGYQTIHPGKLFNWPSVYYNIDPAVSLPIFDGGTLISNLRTSEINYDLAILKYNELILKATREVLDGISILCYSKKKEEEYRKIVNDREKLFKLTSLRTAHNLGSILDIIKTEEDLLLALDQQIIAEGATIQAMLSLIKALGGGYQTCLTEGISL